MFPQFLYSATLKKSINNSSISAATIDAFSMSEAREWMKGCTGMMLELNFTCFPTKIEGQVLLVISPVIDG